MNIDELYELKPGESIHMTLFCGRMDTWATIVDLYNYSHREYGYRKHDGIKIMILHTEKQDNFHVYKEGQIVSMDLEWLSARQNEGTAVIEKI